MKNSRLVPLLDLPDDIVVDIALISTCCAVAIGALIYLLAV